MFNKSFHLVYMAAAVQRDVMEMFYGPIPRGLNRPKPDIVPERLAPLEDFVLLRNNNFQRWLHV